MKVYPGKREAAEAAQEIADFSARPVWWKRYHGRSYCVDVVPTGADGEDYVLHLAIPYAPARKRPTYWAQVLEAYRSLIQRANDSTDGAAAKNLRLLAEYLLDRSLLDAKKLARIKKIANGDRMRRDEIKTVPLRLVEAADYMVTKED